METKPAVPESEIKTCDNCRRDIIASSFLMHSAHCQRNITLCPKCDEPVPRSNLEKHVNDNHKVVKCSKCKVNLENGKLEQHESNGCGKRMVKCSFCEIDCVADEQEEHEDYCGSRTEPCEGCGNYIMLKDQRAHLASDHCGRGMERVKATNTTFPQVAVVNDVKQCNLESRPRGPKRTNDMPQINKIEKPTSKSIDLPLPPGRQDGSVESVEADRLLALQLEEEDKQTYDTFDLSRFQDDDIYSGPGAVIRPNISEDMLRNAFETDDFPFGQPNYNDENVYRYDDLAPSEFTYQTTGPSMINSVPVPSYDITILPCEFCGKPCQFDELIQHQSGCRPDLVHGLADFNQQEVLPNYSSKESTYPDKIQENMKLPIAYFGTPEPEQQTNLVPCEFCGECYPFECLEDHQNECGDIDDIPEIPRKVYSTSPLPLSTPNYNIWNSNDDIHSRSRKIMRSPTTTTGSPNLLQQFAEPFPRAEGYISENTAPTSGRGNVLVSHNQGRTVPIRLTGPMRNRIPQQMEPSLYPAEFNNDGNSYPKPILKNTSQRANTYTNDVETLGNPIINGTSDLLSMGGARPRIQMANNSGQQQGPNLSGLHQRPTAWAPAWAQRPSGMNRSASMDESNALYRNGRSSLRGVNEEDGFPYLVRSRATGAGNERMNRQNRGSSHSSGNGGAIPKQKKDH